MGIQDYGRQINELKDSGDTATIGYLAAEIGAKIVYMYPMKGTLEQQKATWIGENAPVIALTMGKVAAQVSNTLLEREWDATEGGQQLIKVKYDLKALETAQDTLRGKMIELSVEAKIAQNA